MTDQISAGTIVVNPAKPEWGPGKVVRVEKGKLYVFFRDEPHRRAKRFNLGILERADQQSDTALENLPPFEDVKGYPHLPADRITAQQARKKFVDRFPGGFTDPSYLGTVSSGERTYKVRAHERFVETLGGGQAKTLLEQGEVEELARRAGSVVGSVNLLHPIEAAAFKEGLSHAGPARLFFERLVDLLNSGVDRRAFEEYTAAVASLPTSGSMDTDKWTIATVLPFLAQPDEFMFLKPLITQAAAERLGFDLKYEPQPNWSTYEALMTMSRLYLDRLRDLGARDFIDVQSFFWLTSEQFEAAEATGEIGAER